MAEPDVPETLSETLFLQIRDDAKELFDLDPARAELWVSGLLADLSDDQAHWLVNRVAASPLADQRDDTPELHAARLLVAVLAVVADEPLATAARVVVDPSTLTEPSWASALGSAVPVDAVRVVIEGTHTSTVVRFVHNDGLRHLMLIELFEGIVADVRYAPDGLFEDELGDDTVELLPVDLVGLGAELASALEAADNETPSIALNRIVTRRRLEALGEDMLVRHADPTHADPTRSELVDDRSSERFDRDPQDDAAALSVLKSALGVRVDGALLTASELATVAAQLRTSISSGDDLAADVEAVFATAGLTGSEPDEILVARFVGAYAAPLRLDLFTADEQAAICLLEPADWLGAVIGTVRGGAGTEVTPQSLVTAINRCPEITTTIPKADAEYVAWSFELTLHAWSLAGVLDDEGVLTGFGERILPVAIHQAWQPR